MSSATDQAIATLQTQVAQLSQAIAALQDQVSTLGTGEGLTPTYLTTNPDGTVSADFSGRIQAEGITLPLAESEADAQSKNEILWTGGNTDSAPIIAGLDDGGGVGLLMAGVGSIPDHGFTGLEAGPGAVGVVINNTGATLLGVDGSGDLFSSVFLININNLSDLADLVTARENLQVPRIWAPVFTSLSNLASGASVSVTFSNGDWNINGAVTNVVPLVAITGAALPWQLSAFTTTSVTITITNPGPSLADLTGILFALLSLDF